MDEDGKIDFKEYYYGMENRGFKDSQNIEDRIMYETLSKIMQYRDLTPTERIDFDELMALLIEAMNARKKKKHVSLLFDIFDPSKTGLIEAYDLSHVSRTICNELQPESIKTILRNCSKNHH